MTRLLQPLTLLVFRLDDHRFALPVDRVERVVPMVEVTPLPDAPAVVLGAINVHGRAMGVVDTRRRLGLLPREPRLADRLVIATTAGRVLALPVDQVDGVIEAAPEAVADARGLLPRLDNLRGIVVLADGLVVIDDLERFLSPEDGARLGAALAAADA